VSRDPALLIPARFNGPARSANGGFTCGSLAEQVPGHEDGFVEVTLRRPPPLDTAMDVTTDGTTTRLARGEDLVAEARPVDVVTEPVEPVAADVAAEAMLRYPGLSAHPFPTCFACGPERAEGDGLRIFPGPVGTRAEDRGTVASLWLPMPGHADSTTHDDGPPRCGLATTWAALDCVGGWSEDLEGRPCVLGRMTAHVAALPVVGEPHVVVGRHRGRDGRKSFTASALYDADGRLVASATHVWLQVDPATFG
jgi:hypothetical protein